jgi:hypothetical protein
MNSEAPRVLSNSIYSLLTSYLANLLLVTLPSGDQQTCRSMTCPILVIGFAIRTMRLIADRLTIFNSGGYCLVTGRVVGYA